ncbi:MAG: tetratricopeptide repeat protein [Bacteroidales bacterium]|nr:tetratricopeptide repeat protein [Bacteroidales bacterium]
MVTGSGRLDSATEVEPVDIRLFRCYIYDDIKEWERVIGVLENTYRMKPTIDDEFQLLHAQYGFIPYLLGSNGNKEKAQRYIDLAEQHANNILKIKPGHVGAMAMNSALLAFKVYLSPYKAPFLGPKSIKIIYEALKLDANNPYPLLEKANFLQYAPGVVGGNPTEALGYYQKATEILRKGNNGQHPKTWWYMNAWAQMALSAEKAGKIDLARKTFKEILAISPDFKWVKTKLYPDFVKKHG